VLAIFGQETKKSAGLKKETMKRILPFIIILLALTAGTAFMLLALTAGKMFQVQTLETSGTDMPQANKLNPASVYCTQNGNKLEIRTAADGSQNGVCVFPDNSTCDE
jgi:putative hemolysin